MDPSRSETPARSAPDPDPRQLLTAAEAARTLDIPASTIRYWAQQGYLFAVGVDDRSGTQGGGHRSPLYRRVSLEVLKRKRETARRVRRLHRPSHG